MLTYYGMCASPFFCFGFYRVPELNQQRKWYAHPPLLTFLAYSSSDPRHRLAQGLRCYLSRRRSLRSRYEARQCLPSSCSSTKFTSHQLYYTYMFIIITAVNVFYFKCPVTLFIRLVMDLKLLFYSKIVAIHLLGKPATGSLQPPVKFIPNALAIAGILGCTSLHS